MSAFNIFKGTMKFVWIRLAVNLALSLFSILWISLWVFIGVKTADSSAGVGLILSCIAIGILLGVLKYARQYISYMIKSAQIAVIAETFKTGVIPDNMVEFGKERVKKRFAASNVYILLDKLVSGSVRQINRVVNKGLGLISKIIPQAQILSNIAQKFTELSLTYVDECCLCYTFMNDDQSAFKSAADGVVIYFQNWKGLLKSAAKGTAIFFAVELIVGIIVYAIAWAIVNTMGGLAFFIAIVAALSIVYSLRDAFLGSYMMIYTMENFNREVRKNSVSYDLYGKLEGMSSKFKELCGKAREEMGSAFPSGNPQPAYAGAAADMSGQSYSSQSNVPQVKSFCTNCGRRNDAGSAFCAGCGTDLRS